MKYSLFDLHCDTAHKIKECNTSLVSPELHININNITAEKYVQTAAIWSPNTLDDEACWQNFIDTLDNFKKELCHFQNKAKIATNYKEITDTLDNGKYAFIPAVEDARLIAGNLSRVDELRSLGVRFMTMTWKGESCIGGAFDTDSPITELGISAVDRMFEIGIIPDVSHSSIKLAEAVADIADEVNKPFIATHSNSRAVYDHPRNLTDEMFSRIVRLGGVVGISLCTTHICDESCERCNIDSVMRHIDHYLEKGGERALCLGCDYDGIDHVPEGLENSSLLGSLADAMLRRGYSEDTVNDVFFGNAMRFAENNLI